MQVNKPVQEKVKSESQLSHPHHGAWGNPPLIQPQPALYQRQKAECFKRVGFLLWLSGFKS